MNSELLAPAKINLGLEILRRRPDGYHDLNTLFYSVRNPHDVIRLEASSSFRLTSSDASLHADQNLIMRAARLFSEAAAMPLPALHVHLQKRIPMGAGLGGGSSDAAAMLRILDELYPAALSQEELLRIAAKVGADVPFFLIGAQAAVASGIGEVLTPIELSLPYSILVVKDPSIGVPTKAAYEGLRLQPERQPTNFAALFESSPSLPELREKLRNDFEPTVFERYPQLRVIKERLYELGAGFALMSGSGSALFGLFAEHAAAEWARNELLAVGCEAFLE